MRRHLSTMAEAGMSGKICVNFNCNCIDFTDLQLIKHTVFVFYLRGRCRSLISGLFAPYTCEHSTTVTHSSLFWLYSVMSVYTNQIIKKKKN